MTDTDAPVAAEVSEERDGRGPIEVLAAILLGLAGLLTAYAAYHGGLAGGDAIKGYSEATISRNEANGYYNDYTAQYNQDMNTFLQFQVLVEQGQDDVAEVIRDRMFSDELEAGYTEWETLTGDDDVYTPLDTESYSLESLDLYSEEFDSSTALFEEAAETDDRGDQMDLAGVFLAVSLFFAGIAAVFRSNKISYVLLAAAAGLVVPGCLAIGRGKGWIG